MEFFIIDNNGQQAGPFSMDQLVQKGISPETLVWKQGMADWTPAWKVEDLRAVLEAVEADKVNQNSNQNQGFNQEYKEQFTDDASVIESLGCQVAMVEGNRENIKITTPFDIKIAEALLK